MADALDAMWDPVREVFAIYGKMWIDGPDGKMYWKHAAGRTESKDFIHWSQPQLVMTPDEFDPDYVEFHTTPVFYYEGVYFACPQILNRNENGGSMDIELAISRDGINFQRPFRKPFFLPRASPGAFDSACVFTNTTPVVLDDEIRFYYGGYSGGATGDAEHVEKSGIGLATMRRDRFVGVRPIEKIGQITLKPIGLEETKSRSTPTHRKAAFASSCSTNMAGACADIRSMTPRRSTAIPCDMLLRGKAERLHSFRRASTCQGFTAKTRKCSR